jgi:NDP-sugar pyrophosphorylase family protein
MRLVVLAAGVSSRMKRSLADASLTDQAVAEDAAHKPKSMLGIGRGNRPFLDYLLWNARAAGYRDVVLVVGEDDAAMRSLYGTKDRGNDFHGLVISYARQPIPAGRTKPLGTADALERALALRTDWAGSAFTVCNSDNLYSPDALALLAGCTHSGALIDYDRDALGFDEARIRQFAVIARDSGGFLTRIIEKPTDQEIAAATGPAGRVGVSMNIFRFSYDLVLPVLRTVPLHPVRQEKELPSAVASMVRQDARAMMTIPLAEPVPDLTSLHDVARVREFLESTFSDFTW